MSGTESQNSSKREVLLKTVSTWDNEKFGSLNIQKPEATVLKIIIEPGEALPYSHCRRWAADNNTAGAGSS